MAFFKNHFGITRSVDHIFFLYLEFDVLKMASHFFSVPHLGKVAVSGKILARTDHGQGGDGMDRDRNTVTLGMLTRKLLQEGSSCQSDAPWPERSTDR